MGQSTDAILFYGILVTGEDQSPECPWEGQEMLDESASWSSFDDVYMLKAGLIGPEPSYEDERAKWDKWLEKKMKVKIPVEWFSHCSGEYPMWAMAARGLRFSASRGYPHTFEGALGVLDAQANLDALKAIEDACTLMGIEFKEPEWHLVSDWS